MAGPTVGDVFAGKVIEWRGRKFVLQRPSFVTESAYRDHLEREARKAVSRNRGDMDATEYQAQLRAWQESCSCKAYDYGTAAWAKSLESRENACRFFYLIFTQPGLDGSPSPGAGLTLPEMDELWKEKAGEISECWRQILETEADPPAPARGQSAPAA